MSSDAGSPPRGAGLPAGARKMSLGDRREAARDVFGVSPEDWYATGGSPDVMEISDIMIETAIGCAPIPLGIADGFLIDGEEVSIPMAVEEPSVIAAASFAARLVGRDGGFTTWAAEPLMRAQIFLENVDAAGEARLGRCGDSVRAALAPSLRSMARRGGGYRGLSVARLPETGAVRVEVTIDVRDAMGANLLNTAAELIRPLLENESGGKSLIAILTNDARERLASASFALPVDRLSTGLPAGMGAAEAARRIVAASAIAQEDPGRAVTHNKGIMNGISSLGLATMNDTRALEAAAHAWAARSGRYRGLSQFTEEDGMLRGQLTLPLALATVGGAVGFHPASRASLKILGNPNAQRLARIAAALGLAQNFAAVRALVTSGIQHGHMRFHAARLAWNAGARGEEARRVATALADAGIMDDAAVVAALCRVREEQP